MSQEVKIKMEPTEIEEHFSSEKKIKVEDNLQENDFQPEKKKIKLEVMDSEEMKIKIEPTEVEEHFSCDEKIKVEDIDLDQSKFYDKWNLFFVKHLSSEVTEEKLKSHFSICGNVTEVKIFTYTVKAHDNLVYSAFIKYATKKEAVKAMKELNVKEFMQRKLQLMWPKLQHLKILLETYNQPAKKKIKLEVTESEETQKLKVEDFDLKQSQFYEIQGLKETIENLKQEKLKIRQGPKKCKNRLKKLNLKLLDVMKELVTLI